MAASRAVEIRQRIADPADLLTLWELANTYALYAQCLTLMGDTNRASMVVQLGTQLTDLLGPGAAEIRTKLQAVAEVLREAPQVTQRSASAAGSAAASAVTMIAKLARSCDDLREITWRSTVLRRDDGRRGRHRRRETGLRGRVRRRLPALLRGLPDRRAQRRRR
jgi:hypothetical protein